MATIRDRHDAAEPIKFWPQPDMSILAAGRSDPVAMPPALFGETWGLLSDLAQGAGAPVDYAAISLLGVAASLVGGKRKVKPYATAAWTEPCILWVALVGDPSSNKSPAIDAATEPLRGMEAEHADDHANLILDWEARMQRAKMERKAWEQDVEQARKDEVATPPIPEAARLPDEPVRRRLLVQDATPEAMGAILGGNPYGTLHLRDELAGWWGTFERYSTGGREFWLEAFGGRPFAIDRKGAKGALRVPFNGVSVMGGVQPEKLAQCLLAGADDGLVPRFLWAWPARLEYRRPSRIADQARLDAIYRRLDDLRPDQNLKGDDIPVVLPLDDVASDIFEKWMRENADAADEATALYKSFCGKLPGIALRLSLVAELLAWADSSARAEPVAIGTKALIAALDFVDSYAKPMALRVFGDAALPPVERNAAALGRYIRKTKPAVVNARDIQRNSGVPTLKDADSVLAAIQHLVEAEWLRAVPVPPGAGRKRNDFAVNPVLVGVGK